MKISASFLSIKEDMEKNLEKLDKTNIDYLHVDIMDGIFVPNKTSNQIIDLLKNTNKPKDVHLMVSDVKAYIDEYSKLNPVYITVHIEALSNPLEIINYIKDKNIKVGFSIKPNTDIEILKPYLEYLDLILVMSVEPGKGGQEFIGSSKEKIDMLKELQKDYHYLIEVDGGINKETIKYCQNADIVVIGSYITNSTDYNEKVDSIKNEC